MCGSVGQLSYEHVPPRAAFNDRPLVATALDKLMGHTVKERPRGKVFQRGAGAYTLCNPCNNNTGAWYGKSYVDWVYQGMNILIAARKAPSLYYNFRILPLRVIKQIACMFFSVNSPSFQKAQPDLVRFVLNRESRFLPGNLRIFTFYAVGESSRQTGVSGLLNIYDSGRNSTFAEITFPPFGYVLTFDRPPDDRMVDISYFGRYRYNDYSEITLKLPVFPTISYFPGDYRTQEEIDRAVEANQKAIKEASDGANKA